MSTLNLNQYTHKIDGVAVTPEHQLAVGKKVKTYGFIALAMLPLGLIPLLGFLFVIGSLILARRALKISRENFVADDYEKPARWASLISTILLVLSAIGIVLMIL